jgi:hypothetical protein
VRREPRSGHVDARPRRGRATLVTYPLRACLGLLVGALALARAGAADACINGVEHDVDREVQLVSQAERALGEGRPTAATVGVVQAYPTLASTKPQAGPTTLGRAQLLAALAIVRTEGKLAVRDFKGDTEEGKKKNLAFAEGVIKAQAATKTPVASAAHAELLALAAPTRAEAKKILEDLATRDVVPSAQGWALLAKLRRDGGDKAGAEVAAKRCEVARPKLARDAKPELVLDCGGAAPTPARSRGPGAA